MRMGTTFYCRVFQPIAALLALALTACVQTPPPVPPAEQIEEATEEALAAAAPDCAGGWQVDDGSVETGYGFVPQATDGTYLQRIDAGALPSPKLDTVCICWLKTRHGGEAEFEVVFYEDIGGRPAREPYARVPARVTDIPDSVEAAGRFYEIDVSGVTLAPGTSFIGAHWIPSEAKYLFVCTDRKDDEADPAVDVFFQEDRSPGWTSVFQSKDPIFRNHRAILVRARAKENP